jgi:hypothetical protein
MIRLTALLVTALLAVPSFAFGVSATPSAGSSERVESGAVRTAGGKIEHYRIRLLPLASFPSLPAPVVAQLNQRGCMIPQSFEAEGPENVIHGAFRAANSSDWAALCSVRGYTTLYVFFSGQFASPIVLRSQRDTAWLGAEPGSNLYGSSWGIATRPLEELQESPELQVPSDLDHDAIDDGRLEQSVTIRYYEAGKWIVLNSGGQGD